jgi:hypothetical protein
LGERWSRDAEAQANGLNPAKKCVDFVEGRQWTQDQLAKMKAQGRPAMAWNEIAPLVRLVMGYHAQNQIDTAYRPGHDGTGTQETADALTQVRKQISNASDEPAVDTEVFMDGIMTGRGFDDTRLDFEENDFGEVRIRADDPFSIYPDSDATEYDTRKWARVTESRLASIDEVQACYGDWAADLVRPFTRGETPSSPIAMMPIAGEITPVRAFGGRDDGLNSDWWDTLYGLMGDFTDPYRKSVRLIDMQYWVSRMARVFIDLETGDRATIPDDWDPEKIKKAIFYAQSIGNPLTVQWRRVREVRWTTLAGDVILFDDWSKYDGLTKTGYFPYFRRGQTIGMVQDLIDPQTEINKRGSSEIEIVAKSGNGGWIYHTKSLNQKNKALLQRLGSMPGINIEWEGESGTPEPKRIEPGIPPTAMSQLEQKNSDKLRRIASINESATGELDRVQSGKAVEARQRQAVIGVQMYFENFSRSKRLRSRNVLSCVQKHYTEPRIFRILGEDGKDAQVLLNMEAKDPKTGLTRVLNDVTSGRYDTVIDERPLSATFANGQFEEMMTIVKDVLGNPALAPYADLVMKNSSLSNKDDFVARSQQLLGMQNGQLPPPAPPGAPPPAGNPNVPPQALLAQGA